MEDTLEAQGFSTQLAAQYVLILVLVEDTLEDTLETAYNNCGGVLILVLVEDTLEERITAPHRGSRASLNPCSSGRYS